jgi:hypothetical protein
MRLARLMIWAGKLAEGLLKQKYPHARLSHRLTAAGTYNSVD